MLIATIGTQLRTILTSQFRYLILILDCKKGGLSLIQKIIQKKIRQVSGFPMDFLWIFLQQSPRFPRFSSLRRVTILPESKAYRGPLVDPPVHGPSWVVSCHAKNHQTSGKFVDLYKPTW